MHRRLLLAIAFVATFFALLSAPAISFAYERRTLGGGKYDVVVGWDSEPAYVNQHNAAGIRVSKAGTNPAQPVTGLESTLKIQIRQGTLARPFDLRPVAGQPGYYVADILPTRAGDYVWTFTGSIGSDAIDETFDSADGKFASVGAGSDVAFPLAAPDPDQLGVQLAAAQAAAQSAQMVAYAGVGFGVLGCLLALVVRLTRPRSSPPPLASRRATGERYS